MPLLTAPGDTWGISGPTFLAAFAITALIVLTLALIYRRSALRSPDHSPGGPPGAAEVAFVEGGPSRAIYSSLAGLRAAEAIEVGPGQRLSATAPAPAGLTRLDTAVHDAAQRGLTVSEVARDPRVASALDEIQAAAERAGWLVDAGQRRLARLGGLLLVGLGLVGLLRVVAGSMNDKPFLGILTLALVALGTGVYLSRAPRHTEAWRRVVAELRRRNRHLGADQYPAWSTYGASGAALGVALFGTAVIAAANPALAADLKLAAQKAQGSQYGGAGGGIGGGGCGGDGCGGGCGG